MSVKALMKPELSDTCPFTVLTHMIIVYSFKYNRIILLKLLIEAVYEEKNYVITLKNS